VTGPGPGHFLRSASWDPSTGDLVHPVWQSPTGGPDLVFPYGPARLAAADRQLVGARRRGTGKSPRSDRLGSWYIKNVTGAGPHRLPAVHLRPGWAGSRSSGDWDFPEFPAAGRGGPPTPPAGAESLTEDELQARPRRRPARGRLHAAGVSPGHSWDGLTSATYSVTTLQGGQLGLTDPHNAPRFLGERRRRRATGWYTGHLVLLRRALLAATGHGRPGLGPRRAKIGPADGGAPRDGPPDGQGPTSRPTNHPGDPPRRPP